MNGTTIGYRVTGSGSPIVLLHGLGLDRSMWQPQVDHFGRTRRVITVDVRGAGESGRLDRGFPVLSTQAADLEALLDHLQIERVVLCGVSFGGVLAQEFAIRYPDRLTGLVLCDTFGDMHLARRSERVRLVLGAYLAAPMLLLPPKLIIGSIARAYARWPLARQTVVDGYRRMRRVETARIRCAINQVENVPRIGELTCPVLGLVGDESDQLVELMQRLTAAMASARLRVMTDSFDPSNLCRPEQFNQELQDFLTELDRSAPGAGEH